MRHSPVQPAELAFRADGTLYSPAFDDVYASSAGALEQAQHVFLNGNGLPVRWDGRGAFVILETGFGAGANFLATWDSWRKHAPPSSRLHYIAAEKHPFQPMDLRRLHARWPALALLSGELIDAYPPLVPGFHRVHLDGERVTLTLLFGDVLDVLPQLDACVDAFYLDGFAPARNPVMWSEGVFREVARLAQRDATAATYTVAGAVRQALVGAGFDVERREGFGTKRQMLAARRGTGARPGAHPASERSAIVIGAGLAGTACAARLAARGWNVRVIERRSGPAKEASGVPAGLMLPAFSRDWNFPTCLTVQAYAYARQRLRDISGWRGEGVLQLARDGTDVERQRSIVESWCLPPEIARPVDQDEGTHLAGRPVAGPGLWLPGAGWGNPSDVAAANLTSVAARIECSYGTTVHRFERNGDKWCVLDAGGSVIARAPVLVLANAHAASALPSCARFALTIVRGQLTSIRPPSGPALRVPVCREGYVTPARAGVHWVGAGYSLSDSNPLATAADHRGNLVRLERLLPGFAGGAEVESLEGHVGFRTVSPDRMPLVGPLSEGPGLYACLALASRGLTWAPLLGELVASLVCGEPSPIERDLLRSMDPERFARRPRTG